MTYFQDKLTSFASPRIFTALLAFVSLLAVGLSALSVSVTAAEPASIDPNELVLQAIHRAVWGPSLSCRIRQHSVMGDHQLDAEGQYWQMGQGTGQMKMLVTLKSDTSTSMSTWMQVSDGRLLWTSIGGGEPPRRVYLDRVRQSLGRIVREPSQHPEAALYMAIGGQAEALRCLYFRYRWFKVFAGIDDHGREVWQLVGTLRTEMPSPGSMTQIDYSLLNGTPSPEVPTDVRLTLGRDENLLLFPHRIDYYLREKSESGRPGKLVLVSTIEREEVESPISVPREFFHFQVPDEADQIYDETSDYMPLNPQADAGPTLRR